MQRACSERGQHHTAAAFFGQRVGATPRPQNSRRRLAREYRRRNAPDHLHVVRKTAQRGSRGGARARTRSGAAVGGARQEEGKGEGWRPEGAKPRLSQQRSARRRRTAQPNKAPGRALHTHSAAGFILLVSACRVTRRQRVNRSRDDTTSRRRERNLRPSLRSTRHICNIIPAPPTPASSRRAPAGAVSPSRIGNAAATQRSRSRPPAAAAAHAWHVVGAGRRRRR